MFEENGDAYSSCTYISGISLILFYFCNETQSNKIIFSLYFYINKNWLNIRNIFMVLSKCGADFNNRRKERREFL